MYNLKEFFRMAGTKKGGQAAAHTNKQKHGSDFYARIGAMGGKKGTTGGFFANRELAREAGRKGGRISRRTKTEKVVTDDAETEKVAA
jgi:general stress protein YciG